MYLDVKSVRKLLDIKTQRCINCKHLAACEEYTNCSDCPMYDENCTNGFHCRCLQDNSNGKHCPYFEEDK